MHSCINIKVNGKNSTIEDGTVLSEAVELWEIKGPFAITVNSVLVSRAHYAEHELRDGDIVDVIYPIQGG
ncbi:sulfur carrier protein ThiS [Anaplasma bovis]|uniref:sulfur carrier protein ThiS n=1 Tax=Anaplasma bovis TaxID=186733 RepID=UPI002FF21404